MREFFYLLLEVCILRLKLAVVILNNRKLRFYRCLLRVKLAYLFSKQGV